MQIDMENILSGRTQLRKHKNANFKPNQPNDSKTTLEEDSSFNFFLGPGETEHADKEIEKGSDPGVKLEMFDIEEDGNIKEEEEEESS